MERVIEVFRCEMCGEVHEDDSDARDCCEPEITRLFKCTACGEIHSDEEEAEDCCIEGANEDHDIDGRLYMAQKLELERAGQLRLL